MLKVKVELSEKEILTQFFDNDKDLYEELKPSKKEIVNLENFEWRVYVDNGYKNINGGYANITILDGDEEEFILEAECGEQDMGGGGHKDYWQVRYDRQTEKFEEN